MLQDLYNPHKPDMTTPGKNTFAGNQKKGNNVKTREEDFTPRPAHTHTHHTIFSQSH